jgi:hypothetical protein
MTVRRRVSGEFELPISASDAIGFFTPEGERSWVPGWDPTYPAGEPTETDGTVFVTDHWGIEIFWIIDKIDRTAHTSAYSRITLGRHAGTVKVICTDQLDGRCVVTVTYDMTNLAPHHPDLLDAYNDEHFNAMMRQWATDVGVTLP